MKTVLHRVPHQEADGSLDVMAGADATWITQRPAARAWIIPAHREPASQLQASVELDP
jgi:hypothetical protein